MSKLNTFFLVIAATMMVFTASAQYGSPPRNLQFDSLTLVATWEPPRSFVLDEHFEGAVFPPANWQDSTQGMGWFATANGSSATLNIPPHTTYAVVNNSLAGTGNNGCCDYLITPEMDLTQAEGYTLSFISFFRGWDAETATVEISTDGGNTWMPLLEVLPHFAWAELTVDLSAYSGPTGSQHVQLTFKASDNGYANATGWAVDDVVVMSEEIEVEGYGLFWDGTIVTETSVTTYTVQPESFPNGFPPNFCIAAQYDFGYSQMVCADFPLYYLAPPTNLQATANFYLTSVAAILTWEAPAQGDSKTEAYHPISSTNAVLKDISEVQSVFVPIAEGFTLSDDSTVIYSNGTIVNSPGTGSGGNDESVIQAGGSSFGFGMNQTIGYSVADDFVITENATINSIEIQGYQPYSGTTSLFTGVFIRIYSGNPANGQIVWGDLSTNLLSSACFSNIYRVNAPGNGVNRPVMTLVCSGLNIALSPGSYWIEYQTTGSLSSGPWAVNVTGIGNAMQYNGSEWVPLIDPTGIGIPFVLKGHIQQQAELLSYNLYRNDAFITNIPASETEYWDLNLDQGTYNYQVSALYDLTDLGFPGQIGESLIDGPASVDIMFCSCFPFLEDWTTGQFDTNLWTVGPNWIMDSVSGNPLPAAKFQSQPQLTNYTSSLISFGHHANFMNTSTPYCIWFDFDYLLDDISASGTEKLTIEISDGDTWVPVGEITNNGDLGWTKEHINITTVARNKLFRVRFNANGANSALINYWIVDNIHIYPEYSFAPPANFSANNTGNTQQNEIQLEWDIPLTDYLVEVYADDSTYENSLGINPGYSAWLGNKLNTGKGELRAAEVWWEMNGNTSQNPVFVDVFDASHTLLGSSGAFVPAPGSWQLVALPYIAIDGDFYTMVRFERQAGTTAMLGMDSTTNSGRTNAGWYYDGSGWSQMSMFGFDECVFSLRAVVKKDVDCENNVIEKSTVSDYNSSRNSMKSDNKSFSEFGLQSFDVYRREYQIPLPGQDSLLTDWQKIATLSTNTYLDQNLDFKCYQYYVEAMYSEGSSGPSNTDETCFLVGMDDLDAAGIKIYPNPAHDFIAIETAGQVEQISIYNSIGAKVFAISQGTTSSRTLTMERLDVSPFSPGIYTIRIIIKGESFTRKFVKM